MRFDSLPEEFLIYVVRSRDDGPAPNISVMIELGAIEKNPFHSLVGPSSTEGRISVLRSRLYEDAMLDANTFLMDYVHPLNGLSGRIGLEPLGSSDLNRIWAAYVENKKYYKYPSWHESTVIDCINAFKQAPIGEQVIATADLGPDFHVVSNPVLIE